MEQPGPTPEKPTELPCAASNQAVPASAGPAPDIWVSAIIGIILLLISWDFAGWLIATAQGKPYDTGWVWTQGERQGQRPAYWEVQHYHALSQSATFSFGLALLVEAATMFLAYKRPAFARKALLVALFITVAATLYNVVAAVFLFRDGVQPILQLLAVAFGGYMVITQRKMLRGDAA